jgi:hypothetical protein
MTESNPHHLEDYMRELARHCEPADLPRAGAIFARAELRRQCEMRRAATRWIRRAYAGASVGCGGAFAAALFVFHPRWDVVAAALGAQSSLLLFAAGAGAFVTLVSAALAWRLAVPRRRP